MRSPWQMALAHPLNLAMLGLIVIAGLLAAWWLAPIGLVLWAIMVIVLATSPAMRLNYDAEKRTSLPMRFQTLFNRLQRNQVSIYNTLSNSPANVRRVFAPVQTEVEKLVNEAYGLALRQTAAENYRKVTTSRADIEAELTHINEALKLLTDPLIIQRYAESRESLEERLATSKNAESRLDKLEAQMNSLATELDTVVAQVATIQTYDASEMGGQVQGIVEKLEQERREIKQLEQTLRGANV